MSYFRLGKGSRYTTGIRRNFDTIVFDPEDEAGLAPAPPVRIYVGTEPSQYRAERVLVWSIARHRDVRRRYEIHLLKDLDGIERSNWATGFTNYRFAIPHLSGESGRAIYNDVDQIYLSDPAKLFDADMQGHGVLSTSSRETSVMLIDCERMAQIWPFEEMCHNTKKQLLAKMNEVEGLRGDLDPNWNACDGDYVKGQSRLLHFTTLHTQPWKPEPDRFAYRTHPHARVWNDLEREADAAGFMLFTRDTPSQRYSELLQHYLAMHRGGATDQGLDGARTFAGSALRQHVDAIGRLIETAGAASILDYGSDKAMMYQAGPEPAQDPALKVMPEWGTNVPVRCYDPAYPPYAELPAARFDGVISTDVLELVPEEDVPWVLDEIFSFANAFVYCVVACYPAKKNLPNGVNAHCSVKEPQWWESRFREVGRRHPKVHWELVLRVKNRLGRKRMLRRHGGPGPDGSGPRVWVLADERIGNSRQAEGLAQCLGYPYEKKPLRYTAFARLHNRILGASTLGVHPDATRQLVPPWPDLVIAAGRRTAPIARWIAKRSGGRTRTVQLGRKGGDVADRFDAVVTPTHCGLAASPQRIETLLPITSIRPDANAHSQVAAWAGEALIVTVLVGGSTNRHRFDRLVAERFAADLGDFAAKYGAKLLVMTSRRTGDQSTRILTEHLGDIARVVTPEEGVPRYAEAVGIAHSLIVTGESESMLADAVVCGKRTYIYPLPEHRLSPLLAVGTWVHRLADAQPKNDRATTRPQSRLEYLCARLIERGIIRPPRNLSCLHATLYQRGLAHPFGDAWPSEPPAPFDEGKAVAAELRRSLALPPVAPTADVRAAY